MVKRMRKYLGIPILSAESKTKKNLVKKINNVIAECVQDEKRPGRWNARPMIWGGLNANEAGELLD